MRKGRLIVGIAVVLLLFACSSDDDVAQQGPGGAVAKRVVDAGDLIGGPMAAGRIGDYLLSNDRIRVIVQDVGRDPLAFVSSYGGNIIDADLVRGVREEGNDNFMAMSQQINVESTFNALEIEVVNDGSNGRAAVLRATGVDDCLDYINASQMLSSIGGGLPLSLPDSADDADIPVELVTEYTLAPGSDYVKIETFIKNTGCVNVRPYIGDYVVSAGRETDLFVPGIGYGEPMAQLSLNFAAIEGEGRADGIAYGYIPGIVEKTTAFIETGVVVTSIGTNVVAMLLLGTPSAVNIPPDEVYSFSRYFVVGTSVASIQDARNEIFGLDTGMARGVVTVDGAPLAGATVSVVQKPGAWGACSDVLSSFKTDADGRYEGTLPVGTYGFAATKSGYLYDSGSAVPDLRAVEVTAGGTAEADFELPPTGRVRITAVDDTRGPVPFKATVVGFDPSPPQPNVQSILGLLDLGGWVFDDPSGENLFGLTKTVFAGADGDSGEFHLEPGDYHLFVSRGPEYSLFETALEVTAGDLTEVEARIARVVDTAGFVSGDFHVHMMNSPDSKVPLADRVTAFLAEGVDYLVATDHEFLTDLKPTIANLGAGDLIATSVGQEITPQDYGHFNGWPLTIDPTKRNMGAIDWAKEAPPGEDYTSLGAYCMSPGEIFDAVHDDPGIDVVQANHFNSGGGGGFDILGFDTGQVPPVSSVDPAPFRLDPTIENLFDTDLDGLELLIGNDRGQVAKFYNENLGDWFNLMNQGLVYFGSSDSDTHSLNKTQSGTFRNFIASSTDSPGAIDEDEMTTSVRDGRTVGGYSPFLRATVTAEETRETGGHALGLPTLVTALDGEATFHLQVQSPVWVEYDTVALYINNIPDPFDDDEDPATPPRYEVSPNVILTAGVDFDVIETVHGSGFPGAALYESDLEYMLDGLVEDTWIVAVVWGTDGVSRPLFPVIPNDLDRATNETLADLLDGNLGEEGMMALAFTNPLFIDVDGNGIYDAPLAD